MAQKKSATSNNFDNAACASETIPSGSLVIAMDNNLQSVSRKFNLKAYGLAVRLLHAGIPLKWAIKSGKAKDAIDFTTNATRVKPSAQAVSSRSFLSGPLVIDVADKTAALAIITSFGNNVNVYELTQNTTVDIKHTLTHKPKAAVLNDGGNVSIHTGIYSRAGLTSGTHYTTESSASNINGNSCYTFASEPHSSNITAAKVNNVVAFLNSGGNFLGQYEAVKSYTSTTNPLLASFSSKPGIGGSIIFDNADEPYIQIQGGLDDTGGSVKSFKFTNNPGLRVAYDSDSGTNYKAYFVKLASSGSVVGGYVHYLASHEYGTGDNTEINDQRMLLNALLRPSDKVIGAKNNTTVASITENETKTLVGAPSGGTWSIVSFGGSISRNTYTPANIASNTTVVIRYTIPADNCYSPTQVWATNPEDTQKLVKDILANLKSFIPVTQNEKHRMPKTYAAKVSRVADNLVLKLRSDKGTIGGEIEMEEKYSETAGNVKQRYNPINAKAEQIVLIDIKDAYEYDGLIKVNGEVEDAFYHADGNWGLDFDSKYTKIQNYFVSNNFDRIYNDDELAINRNVEIKATSEYDYLTVYKSLLPGTLSADYTEYNYVSFTAKGNGLIELGLIKSSIEDWKKQYRLMVDLSKEEQTYYVPFDIFSSTGTQDKMVADDLTTLTFTFLPVEAQTKELDLTISDVKFVKVAGSNGVIIEKEETFENELMTYPNPSKGNVNVLLFSKTDTEATVTLTDVTGKTIHKSKAQLTAGKNELEFDFKVKTGVYLLKVSSGKTNYGTSKIIFK